MDTRSLVLYQSFASLKPEVWQGKTTGVESYRAGAGFVAGASTTPLKSRFLSLLLTLKQWGLANGIAIYYVADEVQACLDLPPCSIESFSVSGTVMSMSDWCIYCDEELEKLLNADFSGVSLCANREIPDYAIVVNCSQNKFISLPLGGLVFDIAQAAQPPLIHYAGDRVDYQWIEQFCRYWLALYSSAENDGLSWLTALDTIPFPRAIQSNAVNRVKDCTFDQAARPYVGIAQQFKQRVAQAPDDLALVFEQQKISYAVLYEQVQRVAFAIEESSKPGQRVALCLPRSHASVIGFLAIIYCGRVYVPIDVTYPQEHSRCLLALTQPALILCDSSWQDREQVATALPYIFLDQLLSAHIGTRSPEIFQHKPPALYGSSDPFCILFTSGSTGRAKAVVHGEGSFLARFEWQWSQAPFLKDDVCCQRTTLNFGPHIWEMLGGLLQGVPTVVVGDAVTRDPLAFAEVIAREGITRFSLVPSMAKTLVDSLKSLVTAKERFANVRCISIAGEAADSRLIADIQSYFINAKLFNDFGSTETNCLFFSKYGAVTSKSDVGGFLGQVSSAAEILITDENGLTLAPFTPGYLKVKGVTLALGTLEGDVLSPLWREAEKTNTQNESGFEQWGYATGDRVYFDNEGNIFGLGRTDNQVKIRAARVNLDSVRDEIAKLLELEQCAVVARKMASGENQLVAFVVPVIVPPIEIGAQQGAEQKQHLAKIFLTKLGKYLPPHYLPSQLYLRPALPKLANGKLDRLALINSLAQPLVPADEDDLEGILVAIIRRVSDVHVPEVQIFAASLTDLGIDSISVVQLVLAINERFNISLALEQVFLQPDFSGLCENIYQRCDQSVFSRRQGLTREVRKTVADDLVDLRQFILSLPHRPFGATRGTAVHLVTGATGYIGAHLVFQLLMEAKAVVCVVRGVSSTMARQRLLSVFTRYRLVLSAAQLKQLTVCAGDLSLENFALAPAAYKQLCASVGYFYHLAADINHLAGYGSMRESLCKTWKQISYFVSDSSLKNIIFVSSVAVNRLADGGFWAAEKSVPVSKEIASGYGRAKWLGEEVLLSLKDKYQTPVYCLRMPEVGINTCTGISRDDDLVHNFLNIFQALSTAPIASADLLESLTLDVLPVDWVAAFMCKLSDKNPSNYTLLNCGNLLQYRLFKQQEAGFKAAGQPWKDWLQAFDHQAGVASSQLLKSIRTFTRVEQGRALWLDYFSELPLERDCFLSLLGQLELEFPAACTNYVQACSTHWEKTGFLIVKPNK